MIKLVIKHTSLIKIILVSVFVISTLLGGYHKAYSQCTNYIIETAKAFEKYKQDGVEVTDFSGKSVDEFLTNKEVIKFLRTSNANDFSFAVLKYTSGKSHVVLIPKNGNSGEAFIRTIENGMFLDVVKFLDSYNGKTFNSSVGDPRGWLYDRFVDRFDKITYDSGKGKKAFSDADFESENVYDLIRALFIKRITLPGGSTSDTVIEVGEGKDIPSFNGRTEGVIEFKGVDKFFSDIIQVQEVQKTTSTRTPLAFKNRTNGKRSINRVLNKMFAPVEFIEEGDFVVATNPDGSSVRWRNNRSVLPESVNEGVTKVVGNDTNDVFMALKGDKRTIIRWGNIPKKGSEIRANSDDIIILKEPNYEVTLDTDIVDILGTYTMGDRTGFLVKTADGSGVFLSNDPYFRTSSVPAREVTIYEENMVNNTQTQEPSVRPRDNRIIIE